MPRKKRTIIDETIPDMGLGTGDSETSLDALDLPDMEDETLQGLMGRLKGISDYKVNIYLVTPQGSQFRFTVDDPDILDENYIQEVCGPGKYAVRVLVNNIPKKTYFVSIGPKPNVPGQTPTTTTADTTSAIQAQMYRDQLAFMQSMVLALINKEQPRHDNNLGDVVAAVSTLQGLGGGKDPMDLFIRALEIGKGLTGGGERDWKTELISTAKDVLAPVAGEIAKAALNRNPPTNGNHALPSAGTFVEEVNNAVPDVILKQGMKWVKGQILGGMDVNLAIAWIINNGNDPTYRPFVQLALRGEFQDFVKLDNELANEPFNTWMRAAIAGIKEAYVQQQSDTDTTGEDGDTDNTANNAAAS